MPPTPDRIRYNNKAGLPEKEKEKEKDNEKVEVVKKPVNKKTVKKTVENKVTYHWIKNKTDLCSWSGREKEWYYSEKRLLFSTPNPEDKEKWLSVINWVINKNTMEEAETVVSQQNNDSIE